MFPNSEPAHLPLLSPPVLWSPPGALPPMGTRARTLVPVPWEHIQGGSIPLGRWVPTGGEGGREAGAAVQAPHGAALGHPRAAEAAAPASCANQE